MWFECKIRHDHTMENGMQKKVTDTYTVEAYSFTEAEARITEEMATLIDGDFNIQDISRAPYKEVVTQDNSSLTGRYYKCRVVLTTIDGDSGKEKRTSVYYLVEADNIDKAKAYTDELFRGTMTDYEVASVAETKLIEVFMRGDRPQNGTTRHEV